MRIADYKLSVSAGLWLRDETRCKLRLRQAKGMNRPFYFKDRVPNRRSPIGLEPVSPTSVPFRGAL